MTFMFSMNAEWLKCHFCAILEDCFTVHIASPMQNVEGGEGGGLKVCYRKTYSGRTKYSAFCSKLYYFVEFYFRSQMP